MSRIAFPLMAMFVVVGCRCVMPPAQQVVTRDLPYAQPRANQGGCFADRRERLPRRVPVLSEHSLWF